MLILFDLKLRRALIHAYMSEQLDEFGEKFKKVTILDAFGKRLAFRTLAGGLVVLAAVGSRMVYQKYREGSREPIPVFDLEEEARLAEQSSSSQLPAQTSASEAPVEQQHADQIAPEIASPDVAEKAPREI